MPENANDLNAYRNEPWARALTTLGANHLAVLADLELVIAEACKKRGYDSTTLDFHLMTRARGDPDEYWTKGAVSEGIADLAVESGVLSPDEKAKLFAKHRWNQSPVPLDGLVEDAGEEVAFLGGLVGRLGAELAE